jgi:predicted nucleic acid-binding protein
MIFFDANFLINYYVETNENHERAKEIMAFIGNRIKIISNLVIMEVITVLNTKLKQDSAMLLKVYKELNEDYKILIDNDFYDNGFEMVIKELYNNERVPLFDCVYMALMEELEIKEIATFDEHFDLNRNIKRIY